jgi:putative membrane protein
MNEFELAQHRTELSNARSHMANERTHLAYLRTSLSLLTFGITLNRFSLYLRENKTETKYHSMLNETQFVGIGMVVMGVGILCWALKHYRKVSKDIDNFIYTSPQKSLSIFTLAIILIGGLSAIWMILNQFQGG